MINGIFMSYIREHFNTNKIHIMVNLVKYIIVEDNHVGRIKTCISV